MTSIKNEKGGILVYVLFAMTVLMLFVPILLNITSTDNLKDTKNENGKKATLLAVSAMESFVSYLYRYTGTDKITYFKSYPHLSEESAKKMIKITLPEGTKATYTILYKLSGTKYNVTAQAIVGDTNQNGTIDSDEPFAKQKSLTYGFTVTNSSGSTPGGVTPSDDLIDNPLIGFTEPDSDTTPSNHGVLTAEDLKSSTPLYYDQSGDNDGVIDQAEADQYYRDLYTAILPSSFDYGGGTGLYPQITNLSQLKVAMDHAINRTETTQTQFTFHCACSNVTMGTFTLDYLNDSNGKTFVVHMNGDLTLNSSGSVWRMRGMLLIDGKLNITDNKADLNVTNVIVKGVYDPTGGADMTGTFSAIYFANNGNSTTPTGAGTVNYTYPSAYTTPSGWDPTRNH